MRLLLALALFAPISLAQPAARFDVASVKPNPECGARRGGTRPGTSGRLYLECQTVTGLIMTAYGVFADGKSVSPVVPDISGGPSWAGSDPYDISALAGSEIPFPQMAGPMLRALLEERFHLQVHWDIKEVPVYFLTIAKSGSKLQPTPEGTCVLLDPNHPPSPRATPGQALPNYCGIQNVQRKGSAMSFISHGSSMEQFIAIFLSRTLDRPVIDKTNLTGRYEIQFDYDPSDLNADPTAARPAPDAPSIFEAIHSRLGLKLEAGKGPSKTLVIDRLERPTAN